MPANSSHRNGGQDGDDNQKLFDIELTDEAFYSYVSISSDRLFDHVTNIIGLLGTSPELGHIYDPVYEAQVPPFECRVVYCENLGIYYKIDEETHRVLVVAIVDQRSNPRSRFEYHFFDFPQQDDAE